MARILLLIPFLLWLIWSAPAPPPERIHFGAAGLIIFLGGYLLLVLVMALWARLQARRVSLVHMHQKLAWFNQGMFVARLVVAKWFAIGLYGGLGWGDFVVAMLRHARLASLTLPGAVIATLPALLAWMGLWWAQYPAERALREDSMLPQLQQDLPVRAPPRFASFFMANLRLQVLFTIVPVLMILLMRDVIFVGLRPTHLLNRFGQSADTIILGIAAASVFVFAPVILKRVLHTTPLPDSPLRRRLEAMCRQTRLRYRDILLWQTGENMANALVMGVIPWCRYILLSDLLLETMTDQQVEAVFAHEVGHVVHRHMAWYAVLVLILMLAMAGPGSELERWLMSGIPHGRGHAGLRWVRENVDLFVEGVSVIAFFLLFGMLSRRFERQADVYAARMMELTRSRASSAQPVEQFDAPSALAPAPAPTPSPAAAAAADPWTVDPIVTASASHVGEYGAAVFSSALKRVAVVNNIPLDAAGWSRGPRPRRAIDWIYRWFDRIEEFARNFSHGSIPARMQYLRELSTDPARTGEFDRLMTAVYAVLVLALLVCGAAAVFVFERNGGL